MSNFKSVNLQDLLKSYKSRESLKIIILAIHLKTRKIFKE